MGLCLQIPCKQNIELTFIPLVLYDKLNQLRYVVYLGYDVYVSLFALGLVAVLYLA